MTTPKKPPRVVWVPATDMALLCPQALLRSARKVRANLIASGWLPEDVTIHRYVLDEPKPRGKR
jgi:hypothetical protein